MVALHLVLLFVSLTLAAVLPRQVKTVLPGQCCFNLHDSTTGDILQQDETTGTLYLNAGKPSGWYCTDLSGTSGILRDNFYNACFLRPDNQFICLDPTPGVNKFTLVDDNTALAHDGSTGFMACPNNGGGELLWGSSSSAGCRAIQLKPEGFEGTC